MQLKIKYLSHYNKKWGTLEYAKPNDSGIDLRAAICEQVVIPAGQRVLVPNGIQCELIGDCDSFEIQIRPRSGLAFNYGIMVVNTPGTIDWGYRGEIRTILLNSGDKDFIINPGDRVCQMVVCPIIRPKLIETQELSTTVRGTTGFGSSGV